MKKSKIILGCIISVIAFVLTLLIGLPSKVYASEVSDYIDENYSNLVYSNNLCNGDIIPETQMQSNLMGYATLEKGVTYTFRIISNENSGATTFNIDNDLIVGFLSVGDSYTFTTEKAYNNASITCYFNENNTNAKAMLNKGAYALPYEPYITGSMIYEQAFNKGVEEAINVNGIWKYIRNVYVGTEEDNNYNFDELKSRGFLSGYEMNLYSMSLVANESYSTIYIDFEFTSAPLTELDFFFKGYNSYTMNIYDEAGEVVNIDVSSLTSLNYEDIIQRNSNFGNYVDTISITASSPDALSIILNNSSYSEGFQNGYSGGFISGKKEGYSQGFNAGLQDEANNKVHYEEGYEDGSISGYSQGYNEGASSNIETNGIKILFNSILSYPVNMISNVFDFDFMGINIASLIMFIVSIGIVVFVVKRFW